MDSSLRQNKCNSCKDQKGKALSQRGGEREDLSTAVASHALHAWMVYKCLRALPSVGAWLSASPPHCHRVASAPSPLVVLALGCHGQGQPPKKGQGEHGGRKRSWSQGSAQYGGSSGFLLSSRWSK